MKLLKVTMIAAAFLFTAPAFAQFSNTGSNRTSSSNGGLINNTDPYNRVTVDYVNRSLSGGGENLGSTNGVALDYIHGFSISGTMPLFFETGVGADYGVYSEDDFSLSILSFAIPANISYKLQFTDAMSLQPYVGLNFKVNASGKMKYDGEDWGDVFSDGDWKRFQMGWHIGAGMNFNKFYVGLSYGTDFIKIVEKTNTGTFKIGVGVNF